jgi:hypothetical protein
MSTIVFFNSFDENEILRPCFCIWDLIESSEVLIRNAFRFLAKNLTCLVCVHLFMVPELTPGGKKGSPLDLNNLPEEYGKQAWRANF